MNLKRAMVPAILLAILPLAAGCHDDSVEISREAADRQAAQNAEMIRLNREVAQGTERLVEADAQSRRDLLRAYRELQVEHGKLTAQLHDLEQERRRVDARRRASDGLSAMIEGGGLLLVVLFSLILARQILASAEGGPDELDLLLGELDLPPPLAIPAGCEPPPSPPPQLQELT